MSKLYPCVYCAEDGYCKKYSDDEVTSWCVQSPCKDEKPSNADRIRTMTDEELAEWLDDVCKSAYDEGYTKEMGEPLMSPYPSTDSEWSVWLGKEAKE